MSLEKFRGFPLTLSLLIALLISCYIQLTYIPTVIPEYGEFISAFSDDIKNLKILMLIVSFMFQVLILFMSIGLEVILVYVIVYFFYRKKYPLRDFTHPIMLTNLCVLLINCVVAMFLLPTATDIDSFKNITLYSPVNYLVKPIIICYFLYSKGILPTRILEWVKLAVVYVFFSSLPGIITLYFI